MKSSYKLVNNSIITLSLWVILVITSCVSNKDSNNERIVNGESFLEVPGGKIWYKVTGSGNGLPVVLIHGGPGGSSFSLKPYEELGNERQIIRYDQLGGGKSDRIDDTTLFTIEHFVNELDLLRSNLDVEKWHMLGHSWGTILVVEYYKKHPERVASLTLGSAALNMKTWAQHTRELVATLPESFQHIIANAETTGNFNDSLYRQAIRQFNSLYVCRKPVLAERDSAFATRNHHIYEYMQGPSEFTITGTLKDYDATTYLPDIKVPTLFTVGEFDEAGPEIIKSFAKKVPGSRYVVFTGAAHITMWDARDENITTVRDFLNSVDSKPID